MIMDSLTFAYWIMTCMDMTPGFGELCSDMVLQKIGYIGLCQSEQQRKLIEENTIKDIMESMKNADSKVYQVEYAKEMQEAKASLGSGATKRAAEPAAATTSKVAKKASPAAEKSSTAAASSSSDPSAAGAGSSQLSSALQQMLAAAKGDPMVKKE